MNGFPRPQSPYESQRQQQTFRDKKATLSKTLQQQATANGVTNVMLNFSGTRGWNYRWTPSLRQSSGKPASRSDTASIVASAVGTLVVRPDVGSNTTT